jgi:hypothetical protein
MTTSATCTSIFYRFTSLPCELRDQIWQAALPERGGPVLYFFKKGGWYPERPAPSDINYDPEDNTNLSFKYRHEVLDPVEIELPIFFVNREAREIALAWIHTHNIKIRVYRKDGQLQAPVFVSNFDPAHDAMYVSLEKWMEFLCESVDRGLELDMIDRFICTYPPDIKRIALPEALFRRESHVGSSLAYLMVMTFSFSYLDYIFLTWKTYRGKITANSDSCTLWLTRPWICNL